MTSGVMSVVGDVYTEDQAKPGLCCLQGCVTGTAVGFSFFVALPTGIILVVLSGNSHTTVFLALGSVLIVLPVIVLLIVIALCLNKKRLPCHKKQSNLQKSRGVSAHSAVANQESSNKQDGNT